MKHFVHCNSLSNYSLLLLPSTGSAVKGKEWYTYSARHHKLPILSTATYKRWQRWISNFEPGSASVLRGRGYGTPPIQWRHSFVAAATVYYVISKNGHRAKAADFEHFGLQYYATYTEERYANSHRSFFAITPVQREKPDELEAGYCNTHFIFPDWRTRHVVQCQCIRDVLEIV